VSARGLKTIIVDDEKLARDVLREHLSGRVEIDIVAECENGFEAVKAITELKPDLVFLDVQMPKLNGFEVLELVDHKPAVVFVTAYDQYAIKAFEVHAVDYLMKPFSRDRLEQSLKRVPEKGNIPHVSVPSAALRPSGVHLERLLVRDGSRVHVIPVDQIDYIEAQDDYVNIRSAGKGHLKQQRLAELETALDQRRFVRIHRSYILNIDRLAKIEMVSKDSREAVLRDGTRLAVSRSGHEKLKGLL
jgi:two-component system LytT family response regulator